MEGSPLALDCEGLLTAALSVVLWLALPCLAGPLRVISLDVVPSGRGGSLGPTSGPCRCSVAGPLPIMSLDVVPSWRGGSLGATSGSCRWSVAGSLPVMSVNLGPCRRAEILGAPSDRAPSGSLRFCVSNGFSFGEVARPEGTGRCFGLSVKDGVGGTDFRCAPVVELELCFTEDGPSPKVERLGLPIDKARRAGGLTK